MEAINDLEFEVVICGLAVARTSIPAGRLKSHVETLIICKLGFSQNYDTFALISLIKMDFCSKFRCTKFINHKLSTVKSWPWGSPFLGWQGFGLCELPGWQGV